MNKEQLKLLHSTIDFLETVEEWVGDGYIDRYIDRCGALVEALTDLVSLYANGRELDEYFGYKLLKMPISKQIPGETIYLLQKNSLHKLFDATERAFFLAEHLDAGWTLLGKAICIDANTAALLIPFTEEVGKEEDDLG